MKRGIFLDRDGVVNPVVMVKGKVYPPAPEDYKTFSFAQEAVETLLERGFLVFIVTNQPDVSKNLISIEELGRIHSFLRESLNVHEIKVCTHLDEDNCPCRKPRPGMIFDLSKKWNIDLKKSYMVGDRWRDIEAGEVAGLQTVLIGDGYGEKEIFPHF